jgi:hypothetical protein
VSSEKGNALRVWKTTYSRCCSRSNLSSRAKPGHTGDGLHGDFTTVPVPMISFYLWCAGCVSYPAQVGLVQTSKVHTAYHIGDSGCIECPGPIMFVKRRQETEMFLF